MRLLHNPVVFFIMDKITPKQLQEFITEYNTVTPQFLRLGQAFYIRFIDKLEDERENLFYVEDKEKALAIINKYYVE